METVSWWNLYNHTLPAWMPPVTKVWVTPVVCLACDTSYSEGESMGKCNTAILEVEVDVEVPFQIISHLFLPLILAE